MSAQLRMVLVDDHPLFVGGLELLLPAVSGHRVAVVGTSGDAAAAAGLVRRHAPDLAVVDLQMPDPGGLRAIGAIRRAEPRCRVVAISGTDDAGLAVAALQAGAEGYVPKTTEPEGLVAPLLAAAAGWSVLPPPLLAALAADASMGSDGRWAELTDEERDLWQLVTRDATTAEIARALHVSERTAKRLVASLLHKLRVSSRTAAAALAGREGVAGHPGKPSAAASFCRPEHRRSAPHVEPAPPAGPAGGPSRPGG